MRRIALPLAAAALAATAPLALSAGAPAGLAKAPAVTAETSTGYQSHAKATTKRKRAVAAQQRRARAERRKRVRGGKPVNLVLTGCVVHDGEPASVELDTLGGNMPMRGLLAGLDALAAPIGPGTRVVLSAAAKADRGVDSSVGSPGDIWAGDRVVVRWRVARGTQLTALPGAIRVISQGPHDDCLPDEFEDDYPHDRGDEHPEEDPAEEFDEAPADVLAESADGAGNDSGHRRARRGDRR
jgi:hypothetical protein